MESIVPARVALVAFAFVSLAIGVRSASAQTGPAGFIVTHNVSIAAPVDRVHDVLTTQVGSWWDPEHTYSGDSKNLRIEYKAGGCFCETMPNGGFVEHGRVVLAMPRSTFRIAGALGPLQESGVVGSLTWTLETVPAGTTVRMTYSVGGFTGASFDAIAPLVKTVLAGQLDRMKRFIETGKPDAPAGAKP
jgi:uncharacterized protein YndB with AHSA1/START domain